jgi:plasmid stabilization system protein ParE
MKYRVEISSTAEAEADSAFLRLSQIASPVKASQWYSGLLQAIESLSQMPKRCPLAREDEYFSQEIHQLLYGRGRNLYRILFTVLDGQTVSTLYPSLCQCPVCPLVKIDGFDAIEGLLFCLSQFKQTFKPLGEKLGIKRSTQAKFRLCLIESSNHVRNG